MNMVLKPCTALLLLTASSSVAAADGTWVKSKAECNYARGERDEFAIGNRTITNLEFSCDVKSRSRKNGYTVVRAACGGEGDRTMETVRYKIDSSGVLHIKIGKQPEEIYRYSCDN